MTPPDLSGVGARLVRPWMLEALSGNAASNRPWLTVKMPNFGLSEAERTRIAARLAVADEIPDLRDPPAKDVPRPLESAAATLIGDRGFNCVNCHFLGPSAYRPTSSAPDFTMAARRVSHAWFQRWVSNPARIIPGTPMPAFAASIPGIAGRDLGVQKEILWRFLQNEAARNGPRSVPNR